MTECCLDIGTPMQPASYGRPLRDDVREFVERYLQSTVDRDPDQITACYEPIFLSLDPSNVATVTHEALARVLPARSAMFASAGIDGLDLADVTELPLDEQHTLLSTRWRPHYTDASSDSPDIVLGATYLLRRSGDTWRVVVYLNHHDVRKLIHPRTENR